MTSFFRCLIVDEWGDSVTILEFMTSDHLSQQNFLAELIALVMKAA